jgi:hypothetical protein
MTTDLLAGHHRAQLDASGLTADVIAARGYWTATPDDVERVKQIGHHADIVRHGPALMLPLHNVHGSVALTIARPDTPRVDGKGKPRKYELPRAAKATLDVPPLVRGALGDPDVPLWIVEGQKKADAAVAHGAGCVVAVLGVWMWKRHAIPAWDTVTLRGRTVYLTFDSDAATNPKVREARRRLRAFLGSREAHVRIVHLEPGPDGQKVGLDDALTAGATLEVLAARSTERLSLPAPADDKRPELDVTALERRVSQLAFEHLTKGGRVFRTATGLVRVENDDGALVMRAVGVPHLRAELDRVVRCVRIGEHGAMPTLPPRDLAELMVHEAEPPLPQLRAVVSSPTFTSDGRLLEAPGYDAASGLLLRPSWAPRPIPEAPTDADVAEAWCQWDDVLADFPFAAPADRTAAMALALTPLVREMIHGPTPLHLVEAALRGAGKGKLVAACLTPTVGPGGWTMAALAREDEEIRKALTAYFSERRAAIVFDNVAGLVRSPVLAKALTDSVWDDRRLGHSESVRYPVRCVFAMTANNPSLSDEIVRRAVPIRLVPQTDRPELRDGFRHPELEAHVAAHRADLFWALAVFVRAWQAAGCPAFSGHPFGSFEAWTRVVGGILEHAGYPDFLANREDLVTAADPDTENWGAFATAWWDRFGEAWVLVSELVPLAEDQGVRVNGESDKARTSSLGMALGARRDRYYGGLQITKGHGANRRAWKVKQGSTHDTSDTSDTLDPTLLRVARTQAPARARSVRSGLEVSEVSEVSAGANAAGVILGSGALVRLRQAGGRILLETLDGSLCLADVPGPISDPAVCEQLVDAAAPPPRRDDVRRILARLRPAVAA